MSDYIQTEEQLLGLIKQEAQESLTLEFKRSEALGKSSTQRSEISKDVSAFANSAGGTILYGVVEEQHVAKSLDAGLDPSEISKEWLEQIINSTIQKRIDGIVIHQIPLEKTGKNKVAFSVNIPQGSRAHQAADKKFYKRFNFQNVPMEEYEIEDIRNRSITPNLEIRLQLHNSHISFEEGATHSIPTRIKVSISNESEALAKYALVDIFLDGRIKIDTSADYEYFPNHKVIVNGHEVVCTRLNYKIAIPGHMPIWKGHENGIPDITIRLEPAPTGASYLIMQRISSPGMNEKLGSRVLDEGSANTVRLSEVIDDSDEVVSRLGL